MNKKLENDRYNVRRETTHSTNQFTFHTQAKPFMIMIIIAHHHDRARSTVQIKNNSLQGKKKKSKSGNSDDKHRTGRKRAV